MKTLIHLIRSTPRHHAIKIGLEVLSTLIAVAVIFGAFYWLWRITPN